MIELRKDKLPKLSKQERERFNELRAEFRDRLTNALVDCGPKLIEIHERKLYRDDFQSFEAYCREEFNISRQRAYQLMDRAKMSRVLDTPVSQAATETMKRIEPTKRTEVIEKLKRNGKVVTAKEIQCEVESQPKSKRKCPTCGRPW